jgi:hypothetical protein
MAPRFSYSLAFKAINRAQRKAIWEAVLKDYRLDAFFSRADMDDLAVKFDVSAGVIEQSVKKAAEIGANAKAKIYNAITLSLEAHQTLVNDGRPVRGGKIDSHSFALEGLNVTGAKVSGAPNTSSGFGTSESFFVEE